MVSITDLIILSQIPGLSPWRIKTLVDYFVSADALKGASVRQIASCSGFGNVLASVIVHFFRSPQHAAAQRIAERQLSRLEGAGGKIVTLWEASYPSLLKKIYDPPPFLFYKGNLSETDDYSIAIVGTRNPSPYGIQVAEEFSCGLSQLGLSVVSGLARGIDTVAHSAVLGDGGRTVAVIGSGIDVIYPPENDMLYNKIAGCGAVLSEYLMGTKPDAANFPRRNRIISGMTVGTVVVESDIKGGAMITASMALDQNREVFAVPKSIEFEKNAGCNLLIKEGRAKLVESVADVINELISALKPVLKQALPAGGGEIPPHAPPAG